MLRILRLPSLILLVGAGLMATGSSAGEGIHWAYTGSTGPERWGEIAEEFSVCQSGLHQSPIDITAPTSAELADIELRYSGQAREVVNNGRTIQVAVAPGNLLVAEGVESELLQFHFHSPSEHRIRGESFPLEVHFVHRNAAGELSVVGVLFRSGAQTSALESIWANFPAASGESKPLELSLADLDFLPGDRSYFRYSGSLTTPPCSEGVRWYVFQAASTVTPEAVARFVDGLGENARPPQPLNARLVVD